jgi:hypothetical protein
MDAILRAAQALGGTVDLSSVPGAGSELRIVLPSIESMAELIVVRVGDERLGLPAARVRRLLSSKQRRSGDGTVADGGQRLNAEPLAPLLGWADWSGEAHHWVVVERDGGLAALGVDDIAERHEALLQPPPPPVDGIRAVAAVATLTTGQPICVLDLPSLWAGAPRVHTRQTLPMGETVKPLLQAGFAHASAALLRMLAPAGGRPGYAAEEALADAMAMEPAILAAFEVPNRPGLRIGLVGRTSVCARVATILAGPEVSCREGGVRDVWMELGNVLASAFLNGLAAATVRPLLPTVPMPQNGIARPLVEGWAGRDARMSMGFDLPEEPGAGLLVVTLDQAALDGLATNANASASRDGLFGL